MKNKIKLGLSAVAAFALIFATAINVQAQEKIAPHNTAVVKEHIGQESYFFNIDKMLIQQEFNDLFLPSTTDKTTVLEDPNAVWFRFDPEAILNEINAKDPANYELVPNNQPPCSGGTTYCGIKATNDGSGKPDLATSTQAYIAIDNYFNGGGTDTNLISEHY